ncbi:hypothetical protein HMSSN139_65660 [Paenibacillus sp. HMSSN-139]|nr:hypothetical protein HMSSN139_65660 [Paenibacillus sp. HMSSN-139]
MTRDYPLRMDVEQFKSVSGQLSDILREVRSSNNLESLRGWEGQAAVHYNRVFDQMICSRRKTSSFMGDPEGRQRIT